MKKEALAFIYPVDQAALQQGQEQTLCYVNFVNGEDAHTTVKMVCPTNIFKYYFWGVTMEVVVYDAQNQCLEVHDVDEAARRKYNMSVCYAMTFNRQNHTVLASDGFVYNLDQSIFANHCGRVLEHMYTVVDQAANFAMVFHKYNGALCNILLDVNVPEKRPFYKYVMCPGFVTMNDQRLRGIVPKTQKEFDDKEKLSQEDIDDMIRDMMAGM
ncbi:MAG: hypothetical protein IJ794_16485 [Lachnospiraceae bacterium]|nr:hypothetical protein [Lachnospiraceae bacterium]